MRSCFPVVALAAFLWSAKAVPLQESAEDPFVPGCITSGGPLNQPGKINVHIVCHTHDDVGWLKTVDQYYYGANNSIQHAGVQYILDTVVSECVANPDRKFTYVEQAFFQRWWTEQTPSRKQIVKDLVESGQLQFINGGWSMHDEACTHFVSMIENTAFGHRFLKEQFGYIPRVGWQVDPFGHSATQATLLSAEVGFDALYFARIDWQEAEQRIKRREMEMMWRPSETLGSNAQVFTGAFLSGSYGPPPGFCFDQQQCDGGFPVMDDLCMEDVNVNEYVDNFVQMAQKYANSTAKGSTSAQNIMFLMGSDFQYENADGWYKNLDKIIHHVNKDGRVNAFYSTPDEYTEAKLKEDITWPVKTDDFLPHANDAHAYWTGFFTSRPTLKRYERVQAGYLQAARQLQLLADLEVDTHVKAALRSGRPWFRYWYGMERQDMDPLAAAVSLCQHHDAITGTEKQHVTYDYAARLAAGGTVADLAVEAALAKLGSMVDGSRVVLCKLLNESVCEASHGASAKGESFSVLVYNPLSQGRHFATRVPVGRRGLTVKDAATMEEVESSVVAATQLASAAQALQNQGKASALEVAFMADLGPFELRRFVVAPSPPSPLRPQEESPGRSTARGAGGDVVIENALVAVAFDGATGLLKAATNKQDGTKIALSQNFLWYESATDGQRSGAYIFRPGKADSAGQHIPCVSAGCSATLEVSRGPVVQEVRQVFAEWVAQTVRVYEGRLEVELEWTVGPIPHDGDQAAAGSRAGMEVISRFSSSIESGDALYTDSNGRDMLVRHRCRTEPMSLDAHCRPSVPRYNVTEPVAGNYFPVNTQVMISGPQGALVVAVDRSQGAASLVEGQLELMVHRRVLEDDGFGVGEPLNETQSISPYDWVDAKKAVHHDPYRIGKGLVARGKHRLLVTAAPGAAKQYRRLQSEVYYEPVVAVVPGAGDAERSGGGRFRGLQSALPENVELLTLEKQPGGSVLLRVGHKFGVNEDDGLAVPVEVPLAALFAAAHIRSPTRIEELSLSGNQPRKAMLARRRRFKVQSGGRVPRFDHFEEAPRGADAVVKLAPLQIRTFQLYYGSEAE